MPSQLGPIRSVCAFLVVGCGGALAASIPQPLRAGIFLDCGGSYSVKVLFNRPFSSGSTQFVSNSGFESPSIGSQAYQAYPSGTLGAWTVNNIDVVSDAYMSADSGHQSVDINMTQPGSIQQTLPTLAGQDVVLQYAYSYNDGCISLGGPPVYTVHVLWNGTVVDSMAIASGASRIWKKISTTLTTKGSDILEFASTNAGNCGIMLDDITITTSVVSSQALGNSMVSLLRPDGTSLPQFTVPNSALTFDAAGTTATFSLGNLPASSVYRGTLSLQVSDGSGTWTTESVAVDDSIGPWMDSARIAPNPLGVSTDSVFFWTSEPITTDAAWSFLVGRLGSGGSPSTAVPVAVSQVDAATNEFLALLPVGQLRNGDSLRLNPATTSDLHANPALACHQDVPLSILSRTTSIPILPKPVRAGVFLDCGGNYSVKVLFDRPFASNSSQAVANSGFETPALQFPSGAAANTMFQEYFGATLGGWTVDNIDLVAAGYMSPDSGMQSIDLNGNAPGSIQQTLTTTPGQNLVLRVAYTYNHSCIDLSGPPPNSATAYTAQVLWNGAVAGTISIPSGTSRTWTRDSFSLVAKGSDVLRIQSTTPGMCGNMLDDITVTATATSAQLLGNSMVTLQRPDGTSLPQITMPNTSVRFDATGTTATFPLGVLPANSAYKGTMTIQVSDGSGTWTTESVVVDDSIGPWMDSARIAPNPLGTSTDSVYFWTSEPVTTGTPWSFLVDRLGSGGSPSTTIVPTAVSPEDASSNEYLALLPFGQLRSGDSLRLDPATASDQHGNPAADCKDGIPIRATVPAIRVDVRTITFMEDTAHSIRSGGPVQVWVRRKGDLPWLRTDGSSVSDTGKVVGATVTANTPLGGTAYIYDNAGVFAASGNLSEIAAMASQSSLPKDSSGTYQIKIGWDGRMKNGTWASSGIYVMRLVLLYHTPETPKTQVVNKVFRIGIKRPNG
jgi:hypothetical protein